jgi:hypothetical protein
MLVTLSHCSVLFSEGVTSFDETSQCFFLLLLLLLGNVLIPWAGNNTHMLPLGHQADFPFENFGAC